MDIPVLKSKLRCPSLPSKIVKRPQLIQCLNEGLESGREITLVSAPAGFGKTTCISEWIDSLNIPVIWLSLDSSDDDPLHFYMYLLAALQTIELDFGQEIEGVIKAGQVPPSDIISASIINTILEFEGRFLLVLDDFQVIQDNNILEVLKKILDNHPQPMHLVFITREDPPLPLSRLRANNKLTEIRAKDLRFTSNDIEVFLNKVMGLSLEDKDIAVLEEKTEGWIAGLQLIGLSVREKNNPSEFISQLSGSHQFILSYITEQVLNQQSEEVRDFLLKTAILDQFNSELCNTVTERTDAENMLERLHRANLFLVPLDDDNQWYRYHHFFTDLLRDLQKRKGIVTLPELHQRASQWYANAEMMNEAIHHALAAEDYPLAIELLETHATSLLMQGYAKTVDNWIEAIPDKWRSKFPKTNLALAWVHLLQGSYSSLFQYIDRVEPHADEMKNSSLRAEWLVMKSLKLYMQGEIETCMKLATEALETTPKQDNRIVGLAYYVQAHVFLLEGDYAKASRLFKKSIQYSREANSLVPEMMSTISMIGAAFERGRLQQAYEIATQAVTRLENAEELPPIVAYVYLALGDIYYQWNQIEEAWQVTNLAFQLSTLGGLNTGLIFCRILYSRLFQIQQNLNPALMEIQAAINLLPFESPKYIQQDIAAQQVRVYLDLNRIDTAELILENQGFDFKDSYSYPEMIGDQPDLISIGLFYNCYLRLLLRRRENPTSLKSGLELATELITEADQRDQFLVSLEGLLLRAQFHKLLGDRQACINDVVNALERGQSEGIISIFVEQKSLFEEFLKELLNTIKIISVDEAYVKNILAAFPDSQEEAESIAPLADLLTDRELDVLLRMAEGLKYKEIASKLYVSLNTIRHHVKAIYRKFNVNNRTQAIEQARKYKII